MKRWIAIFVLTLLLIACIGLFVLVNRIHYNDIFRKAGQDARLFTFILEELRSGQQEAAIASLENSALMKLEVAAQRLDLLPEYEIDLQSARKYFEREYGSDPLDGFSGVSTSPIYDDIKSMRYGELVHVGDVAPSMDVLLADGDRFDLQQHRGRVILLNFFATWCGPCKAEIPLLNKLTQQYRHIDIFDAIAVGLRHNQAEVANYAKQFNLTMAVAADPDAIMFERWARTGIPRTYVINTEGTVVGAWLGFNPDRLSEIVDAIDAALPASLRPLQ